MPLTITSPRNSATRVEPVGTALLLFEAGVATVDGELRPAVERAAKARGYRIALELPAAPPPAPAAPAPVVDELAEDLAVVDALVRAGLPPVPPAPVLP